MTKDKINEDYNSNLYKALLSLQTEEECKKFFDDICTIGELNSIAQRLEVARLLDKEETFVEIGEKTGASSATISRVNRCIRYGEGGYKIVLDRLKENKCTQRA